MNLNSGGDHSSPIRPASNKSSYGGISNNDSTKPTGSPKSTKNFKQVYEREARNEDPLENIVDGEEEMAIGEQAASLQPKIAKKGNFSIFASPSTHAKAPSTRPLLPETELANDADNNEILKTISPKNPNIIASRNAPTTNAEENLISEGEMPQIFPRERPSIPTSNPSQPPFRTASNTRQNLGEILPQQTFASTPLNMEEESLIAEQQIKTSQQPVILAKPDTDAATSNANLAKNSDAIPTTQLQNPQAKNTVGRPTKNAQKPQQMPSHLASESSVETPSAVFSKIASRRDAFSADEEIDRSKFVAIEPVIAQKKDSYTSKFTSEQPDLSYVNPMAAGTNQMAFTGSVKTEKPVVRASDIQSIISQLVDKIQEVKQDGRVDTSIVLKHPPMFSGATVVISTYDTAKGEFNISFQNLTQTAKNILDMGTNQETLRMALEQKGYAVHIITTTTLIENNVIAQAAPPSPGGRGSQGESGSSQRDSEPGSRDGRRRFDRG